jgi:hypothetical protein
VHKNYIKGKGKEKDKGGDRRSRVPEYDGRRFGVVGLDIEDGKDVQCEDQGKRNREAFERWKGMRGFGAGWMEESLRNEEVQVEGEGVKHWGRRERRETFDAWKRGVVPSVKNGEHEVGNRQDSIGRDEDFEARRDGDGVETEVESVGLIFTRKPEEEEEVPHSFNDLGARKEKQVVDNDTPTGTRPSI